MLTIKGHVKDGVVYPSEPVAAYDQEEVLITFLNEQIPVAYTRDVQETKLLEDCQMDTGIEDLAHQHDHYLHGTPKRVDL